jgi:hypothetical protein
MAQLNSDGTLNFDDEDFQTPDPNAPGLNNPNSTQSQLATTSAGRPPFGSANTDPYAMINNLLKGGTDPSSAVDQTNQQFSLPSGGSLMYYGAGAHGPGSGAVIGLPSSVNGGGYLAQGADGTWAYNQGDSGQTPAPAPTNPTGTNPAGADNSTLSQFLLSWLQGQSTSQQQEQSDLYSRLMGLADQLSAPVTASDPNIAAASDAYHGQTQKALQQFRSMAAARANAEGVPTGAFDSQLGNAENTAGQSEASYTTTLMNNELQSRRAALASILQQGEGVLSTQDQDQLNARMDAINGLLGTGSESLTNKGLDINSLLGTGSLNLQELLGMTGLTNQNSQFYDQLASGNSFNEEELNLLMQELGLA